MSQINKTGYTTLALLGESDYENDSTTNSNTNYVDFYFNDEATSSRRPKLTVTYSAGASGPAKLKTHDTVTKSAIKSIDGILIAKVKSLDTIV
jgi:hypothetical protein